MTEKKPYQNNREQKRDYREDYREHYNEKIEKGSNYEALREHDNSSLVSLLSQIESEKDKKK
ncbi:hypothetical protein [Lysinibacillus pakistanensis]|uniref:YfhD family protein n=1 Tax=Lysinibacillus pakistanensis TaxID=759811 RepID=A0AAX3X1C3_9BACI|nr:hypothetical protein [Lysinibacillus pakistanensis]MDM5233493.1 hypothetical protein [Lysinibacillus pakistanensis]WHY48965.1 hypothetical protein QNH22_12300 [Lysinibacillus pakistanensis]WHY53976.1 hypothetical protein QNH24_12280 [Lysinibacillus pakistanensis]